MTESGFDRTARLLKECGNIRGMRDEVDALWFARHMGYVIADGRHTEKQIHNLVSVTYSRFVIACSLRPILSAAPFMNEVRRGIEIWRNTDQKAELKDAPNQLALAIAEIDALGASLDAALKAHLEKVAICEQA